MSLFKKFKLVLVLGVLFSAIYIFNTNTAYGAEIENYKYKFEKDNYILYNNFFDTNDYNFSYESNSDENNNITGTWGINNLEKNDYDNLINKMKSNNDIKLLIEVPNNTISAKSYSSETLEIIELNNKKYVVSNENSLDFVDSHDVHTRASINETNIEITKNDDSTEKIGAYIFFDITNKDFFYCRIDVIDKNGKIYGSGFNTNGIIYGLGMTPIPEKINLKETYVEYLSNHYMGENLYISCLGNVPYVGKYGDNYKYKMCLENVKIKNVKVDDNYEINEIELGSFSYKGSLKDGGGTFNFDPNYTIDNVVYVEQTQSNTQTKLKVDLYGNFNGKLKAEEVSKDDLIYEKVEDELKKYAENYNNPLSLSIMNIYIEEGSFEGSLKLTFEVGEEYNGKYYNILHLKNGYRDFERFDGIVKDGKITIIVDSLSPFGIQIFNEKVDINQEKDDTPNTKVVDIIPYVSIITIISILGIVVLKKKFE